VPPAILGVDFSGAENAGQGIWLARALPDGDRLHIDALNAAADLPNSARQRDVALSALRSAIIACADCLVGLDFPLSLPQALIGGQSWFNYITHFATTYPSADAFKVTSKQQTNGRELRRGCEVAAKVPFAAYNLRLYKQTYYGLRDLVAPLVTARQAVVLPIQRALAGRPALIEICPASTLQRLGLYHVAYKGRDAATRERRAQLLDALTGLGVVVPAAVHDAALDNTGGDALDAVIAAYAAWQAWHTGALSAPPDAVNLVEGRIYF
jgi:hypothetical protein